MAASEPVRLQKVLAEAGVASRRAAERLILEGAVSVNGETVTTLGTRVDPATAEVRVHGEPLQQRSGLLYLALHKPAGYVTTAHDEHGRATVFDLLGDLPSRLYPVGRLDRDSAGLLLLTNDGALTQRLTHPRFGVEKQYQVLVEPVPDADALRRLREGVPLDDRPSAPARVHLLERDDQRAWLDVVLHEGRNRQLRRMCEAVGLTVISLVRVRVGPVELGRLPPGKARRLTPREIAALRKAAGL
ncbi:MAG TPA: pseudouridine synthase [Dehalococcoidia bacterium]|jgi:23S rRNA pseudouridine2605 synthase|nr:pseudouridine synthase [Dehalococcoidia bacterium]